MYSFYDTKTAIGKFFGSRILVSFVATLFVLSTVICGSASATTITVIKDGACETVVSGNPSPSVSTLLSAADLSIEDGEDYELIYVDDQLTLKIGQKITVTVADKTSSKTFSMVFTGNENVLEAVFRSGYEFSENHIAIPSVDTPIFDRMTIRIGVVSYIETTVVEDIPFTTEYKNTSSLVKGASRVSIKGVNGKISRVYRTTLLDGDICGKEILSETVISNPANQVIEKGTNTNYSTKTVKNARFKSASEYPVTSNPEINKKLVSPLAPDTPIQLDKNGKPVSYKQCITGVASAYSPVDGKWTATGALAQVGYIAVDPKQIPYGTLMYIKCVNSSYIYGYAIAADCGAFKQLGRTVDLFFPSASAAVQFGVRNVEIYIL